MRKSRFTTSEVIPSSPTPTRLLTTADYISVVVSGILAKAKKLYKLQVRLCLADFVWEEEQILSNAKLLLSPFERLRNVRQPSLGGVFNGKPNNNSMYRVETVTARSPISIGHGCIQSSLPSYYELCSVPSLPTDNPVLFPGMPAFDAYSDDWRRQISSEGSANVTPEPLIRKMFTEFRNFYTELAGHVPDVTFKTGRHTFLHRARVAREQEDVIAFRAIRAELLRYWHTYLENEKRKKRTMQTRIVRFLESDTYPSHIWEEQDATQQDEPLPGSSSQSPVVLDSETIAREGIPMTGNSVCRSFVQPPFNQMNLHSTPPLPLPLPPTPYSIESTALDTAQKQYMTQKYAYVYLQQQALQRQRAQRQAQQQQQIQIQMRQQIQQVQQHARMRALLQGRQCLLKRKASASPETLPVFHRDSNHDNNFDSSALDDDYDEYVEEEDEEEDDDDGNDDNNNNKYNSSEPECQQANQYCIHGFIRRNLPADSDPDAGPSTTSASKRRRVDSGYEGEGEIERKNGQDEEEEMQYSQLYVGKGKDKGKGKEKEKGNKDNNIVHMSKVTRSLK